MIIQNNGVQLCTDCGAIGTSCCEFSSQRLETSKDLRRLCEHQDKLIGELRATIRHLSKGGI